MCGKCTFLCVYNRNVYSYYERLKQQDPKRRARPCRGNERDLTLHTDRTLPDRTPRRQAGDGPPPN